MTFRKTGFALLTFLFMAIAFGVPTHQCGACKSSQSSQYKLCKQNDIHTQVSPCCHDSVVVDSAAVEAIGASSCDLPETQTTPNNCQQLCADYGQPVVSEKMVDGCIKPKFQTENPPVNPYLFCWVSLPFPKTSFNYFTLRSSPQLSPLTFLEMIRLLC